MDKNKFNHIPGAPRFFTDDPKLSQAFNSYIELYYARFALETAARARLITLFVSMVTTLACISQHVSPQWTFAAMIITQVILYMLTQFLVHTIKKAESIALADFDNKPGPLDL